MPWHQHIQTTVCKSGIKNNSKSWRSLLNRDTYETRVTFESAMTHSSHQRQTFSTLFYQIYLWSRRGRWTVRFCIQCFSLHTGSLKLYRLSSEAIREAECDNMSLKRHWKLHLPGLHEQHRSISIPSNWSWRLPNNCGNYPGYSCMLCSALQLCQQLEAWPQAQWAVQGKEQNGNICQWQISFSVCIWSGWGVLEKERRKRGKVIRKEAESTLDCLYRS